ncbi:Universal stress protein family protein [Halogeometricum rufum]|uniref:Universal stress protein family protein n=1 Tax=Halogeometricum rufum TaxID=553469 RepID=A0A1I6IRS2_9EURY|nr:MULTISPECIES: universal stress protein [Halogeometricum]MUV56016.1 universal stress protein [Halogeometricum sp. CBA1124]SFR68940.1 Universal stress protein family protein [Halogeometricum rufum]
MYQILVPVDDDVGRAVAQAEFVTGLPGVPGDVGVTVVHAYRDDGADDDLPPEQSKAVSEALDRLAEAGVEAESREIYLPVSEGILDIASDLAVDHIVLGGRRRSPAGKAIFGSVTQRVILNADLPVTVVGMTD